MRSNRELALAVKRALATGTIALVGAGTLAAYAHPAATAQTATKQVATAKTTTAKAPLMLAQASDGQTTGQPPTTTLAPPPQLQTVIVTGTMIARPASETAEAITVINANAIKNQGIVNVEQALNTVTSNVPAINIAQSVGTFTGGGTYANLRGLGDARTLVLLDGHRLAANANDGGAVDLSGIPFSAIDSVQVLREGASALYGSDAIAGVINFITKKNYQGGEVQLDVNHPQQAGGQSGYANITFGHGDLVRDGYNFMITGSYTKQNEIRATQRPFSAAGYYPALGVSNTNNPGTWPATVIDGNGNFWQSGYPTCAGNPFLTTDFGNCAYRYSAATDLVPQSSEASGLVSFTKALPGNNTLHLQYLYTQSKVTDWSGPMFYFFEMTPTADPTYYPTASQLTCEGTCGAPPALGGPIFPVWTDPNNNRFNGDLNVEQRALLTFSGDNYGWDYRATLNYSQNTSDQRNTGGYPNEAVLAPTVDPATGTSILSDLINPFGPQSAAGQALINQSYINGTYANGKMKRWSVGAHASHRLGDAFHAGHDAVLALGFDVRGDRFEYATTPYNDLTSAATGLTDSAVAGSRQSQAVFIELNVPMAKSVDVDISDREDRYSDFGTTNNGKISVRYQPFRFLTFRGAASTGFRAPTLYNLYSPDFMAASSSGTMGQGNPLCSPPSATGTWTAATCNTQGLGLYGGNRNLTPETSQNFDLGVVISPIRNMGITLDYYRILLKNTIGGVPTSAIYGNPNNFANYIVLNNAGTLTPSVQESSACHPYTLASCGYILRTSQNTGSMTTDGFDLSVQYAQQTPIGTFHEDLEGTAVTEFRLQQYNGGPLLNLVGWYNENPPAYRWSHELRVNWTSPEGQWGGGLSNRFYSSYIDEFPDAAGNQRTVGSYSTWAAYASFKPIHSLTVLFGIRDLTNKMPPFTNASQGNFAAGYNALVVNPMMRTFYLNLKYKFL
ncbi:MAG: TonB-dependent receptor [Proteobacteria bacterium]|nr:TonB-dependent receptor [Pseudomonadota bacterium]